MPSFFFFFFFNDTATTEIYTLSLHDALPISSAGEGTPQRKTVRTKQQPSPSSAWLSGDLLLVTGAPGGDGLVDRKSTRLNSSHVRISYAVFCLKKKKKKNKQLK